MSNVIIRSLQAGKTIPATQQGTYFADSFLRADQPFWLGDLWNVCFYDNDNQTIASAAQGQMNVNMASGLNITQVTGGSTIPKFLAFPSVLNGALLSTKSQFAEIQCTAINTAVNTGGVGAPMVYASFNQCVGYVAHFATVAAVLTYSVFRFNNAATTTLIASQPWVLNDVLRIEVVPGSSSNLVTVYLNGVQTGQVVDNNAARPTFGMPGLFSAGLNTGGSINLRNFKCGSLPQTRTDANFP